MDTDNGSHDASMSQVQQQPSVSASSAAAPTRSGDVPVRLAVTLSVGVTERPTARSNGGGGSSSSSASRPANRGNRRWFAGTPMPVRVRLAEMFRSTPVLDAVPEAWGDIRLRVSLVFDGDGDGEMRPVTAADVEFTEKSRGAGSSSKGGASGKGQQPSLPCQRRGIRGDFDVALRPRTVVLERRYGYEAYEDLLFTVSSKHKLLRVKLECDPEQGYLSDVIQPSYSEPLTVQTYDNGKRQNGVSAFTYSWTEEDVAKALEQKELEFEAHAQRSTQQIQMQQVMQQQIQIQQQLAQQQQMQQLAQQQQQQMQQMQQPQAQAQAQAQQHQIPSVPQNHPPTVVTLPHPPPGHHQQQPQQQHHIGSSSSGNGNGNGNGGGSGGETLLDTRLPLDMGDGDQLSRLGAMPTEDDIDSAFAIYASHGSVSTVIHDTDGMNDDNDGHHGFENDFGSGGIVGGLGGIAAGDPMGTHQSLPSQSSQSQRVQGWDAVLNLDAADVGDAMEDSTSGAEEEPPLVVARVNPEVGTFAGGYPVSVTVPASARSDEHAVFFGDYRAGFLYEPPAGMVTGNPGSATGRDWICLVPGQPRPGQGAPILRVPVRLMSMANGAPGAVVTPERSQVTFTYVDPENAERSYVRNAELAAQREEIEGSLREVFVHRKRPRVASSADYFSATAGGNGSGGAMDAGIVAEGTPLASHLFFGDRVPTSLANAVNAYAQLCATLGTDPDLSVFGHNGDSDGSGDAGAAGDAGGGSGDGCDLPVLHAAAACDLVHLTRALIGIGLPVDARDALGFTPLEVAKMCGAESAADVLAEEIAAQCDDGASSCAGFNTPLTSPLSSAALAVATGFTLDKLALADAAAGATFAGGNGTTEKDNGEEFDGDGLTLESLGAAMSREDSGIVDDELLGESGPLPSVARSVRGLVPYGLVANGAFLLGTEVARPTSGPLPCVRGSGGAGLIGNGSGVYGSGSSGNPSGRSGGLRGRPSGSPDSVDADVDALMSIDRRPVPLGMSGAVSVLSDDTMGSNSNANNRSNNNNNNAAANNNSSSSSSSSSSGTGSPGRPGHAMTGATRDGPAYSVGLADDIVIDSVTAILARDAVMTGNLKVLADVLAEVGSDAVGFKYRDDPEVGGSSRATSSRGGRGPSSSSSSSASASASASTPPTSSAGRLYLATGGQSSHASYVPTSTRRVSGGGANHANGTSAGDHQRVRSRRRKPLVLSEYQSGYTLLHFAAQHDAHEAIRLVMSAADNARVYIDTPDDAGRTPLFVACRNGSTRAAEALLSNGAFPFPQRPDGWTALHAAAANGHADCVEALVKHAGGTSECANALNAGYSGVTLLNGRRRRFCGQTPVMRAAGEGHVAAVVALLRHGASVNAQRSDGLTALHWATRHSARVARASHASGASPADNDHVDMLRVLLEHGADPTAHLSSDGSTPLHLAANEGDVAAARLLGGALITDAPAPSGSAPACKYNAKVVTVVDAPSSSSSSSSSSSVSPEETRRRERVNAPDDFGFTPLHHAAHRGHPSLCRVLVAELHADVNRCDLRGGTPLHLACSSGEPLGAECAKILVQGGADPTCRNSLGETPVSLAPVHHVPIVTRALAVRSGLVAAMALRFRLPPAVTRSNQSENSSRCSREMPAEPARRIARLVASMCERKAALIVAGARVASHGAGSGVGEGPEGSASGSEVQMQIGGGIAIGGPSSVGSAATAATVSAAGGIGASKMAMAQQNGGGRQGIAHSEAAVSGGDDPKSCTIQ